MDELNPKVVARLVESRMGSRARDDVWRRDALLAAVVIAVCESTAISTDSVPPLVSTPQPLLCLPPPPSMSTTMLIISLSNFRTPGKTPG